MLRNQIDFFQSLYLKYLKWRGIRTYGQFMEDPAKQGRYDFSRRYQLWTRADVKMIVIDYDSAKNSLLDEFLGALGLVQWVGRLTILAEVVGVCRRRQNAFFKFKRKTTECLRRNWAWK